MLRSKKILFVLTAVLLASSALFIAKPATGDGAKSVTCVINMVVETRSTSTGTPLTTTYQKEFTLTEGQSISDDFSTFTRFRFMDASLTRVDNELVMQVDWSADTTTFDAVDLTTFVSVGANGVKTNKSIGKHEFFSSNKRVTTNYSIVCTAN